jgi:hypothetical protein
MLARSILSLGLASISLALPVVEDVDTTVPGMYVTDTFTDEHGIERRSTQAVSKEIHEKLIYYSEYAGAAYCPKQQGAGGNAIKCAPDGPKTCPHVEQSKTKVYNTWLK